MSKLTNRKRKVKLTPKPVAEPSAAVAVEPKPAQQEVSTPEVKAAVEMVTEAPTATETKIAAPAEIKV